MEIKQKLVINTTRTSKYFQISHVGRRNRCGATSKEICDHPGPWRLSWVAGTHSGPGIGLEGLLLENVVEDEHEEEEGDGEEDAGALVHQQNFFPECKLNKYSDKQKWNRY